MKKLIILFILFLNVPFVSATYNVGDCVLDKCTGNTYTVTGGVTNTYHNGCSVYCGGQDQAYINGYIHYIVGPDGTGCQWAKQPVDTQHVNNCDPPDCLDEISPDEDLHTDDAVDYMLYPSLTCTDGNINCTVYEVIPFGADGEVMSGEEFKTVTDCPDDFDGTCDLNLGYDPEKFVDPCDLVDDLAPGGGGGGAGAGPDSVPDEDWTDIDASSCDACGQVQAAIGNQSGSKLLSVANAIKNEDHFQSGKLRNIDASTRNIKNTLLKTNGKLDTIDDSINDLSDGFSDIADGIADTNDILDNDGDGKADDTTENDDITAGNFDPGLANIPEKENLTDELGSWWDSISNTGILSVLNSVNTTVSGSQCLFPVTYTMLGVQHTYNMDFCTYQDHLDFMGSALMSIVSIIGVLFLFGGREGF